MTNSRVLRSLSGFTLSVAMTSAASFATIPLIIVGIGPGAWASLAVGQSVGSVASIFAGLGWGYNGPNQVASADALGRARIVHSSVRLRLRWAVVTCLVPAIALFALSREYGLAAGIACAASAGAGLGFTWFFIGSGDARRLLLWDAVPRATAAVVGAVAALATGSALILSVVLLGGTVIGAVGSFSAVRRALGDAWLRHGELTGTAGFSSKQVYALVSATTSAAYTAAPLILIAALAPWATPMYALADRLNRIAGLAATPGIQWLQGWVPSAPDHEVLQSRARKALALAAVTSATFGATLAFGAPAIGHVLSRGNIEISFAVAAPMGFAVFFAILTRASGMAALLSLGEERLVALSTGIGASVGVALMIVTVPTFGAVGAAWSVASAEGAVCVTQLVRVAARLKPGAHAVRAK